MLFKYQGSVNSCHALIYKLSETLEKLVLLQRSSRRFREFYPFEKFDEKL